MQLIITRTATEILISVKPLWTAGRRSKQSTLSTAGLFVNPNSALALPVTVYSGIPAQEAGGVFSSVCRSWEYFHAFI